MLDIPYHMTNIMFVNKNQSPNLSLIIVMQYGLGPRSQLGQPIDPLVNPVHWVQSTCPILTESYCGISFLSYSIFYHCLIRNANI